MSNRFCFNYGKDDKYDKNSNIAISNMLFFLFFFLNLSLMCFLVFGPLKQLLKKIYF